MPRKRADRKDSAAASENQSGADAELIIGQAADIQPDSVQQHLTRHDDADADRRQRIALAAYYRAERRGFAAGRELDDWLEAENELK
jgi:hypothetical protein